MTKRRVVSRVFLAALSVSLCWGSVRALAEKSSEISAAPAASAPVTVAPSQARLELAEKMHEIWPIRLRVEGAIDSLSEKVPEADRAAFKAAMRRAIKYDQLEEASINAMAQTFTEDELKAMIDFYGSETGQAISAKTGSYENLLRPEMIKMMDGAMLDLRTGSAP